MDKRFLGTYKGEPVFEGDDIPGFYGGTALYYPELTREAVVRRARQNMFSVWAFPAHDAKCEYCGRANKDHDGECRGCGAPL